MLSKIYNSWSWFLYKYHRVHDSIIQIIKTTFPLNIFKRLNIYIPRLTCVPLKLRMKISLLFSCLVGFATCKDLLFNNDRNGKRLFSSNIQLHFKNNYWTRDNQKMLAHWFDLNVFESEESIEQKTDWFIPNAPKIKRSQTSPNKVDIYRPWNKKSILLLDLYSKGCFWINHYSL